jgi:hypothetical protein
VSRQDEASQQRRRYSIDLSHENFDVSTIFSHRILTVISLTETQEVQRAGAKNLSHYLEKNIGWHQLQVSEFGSPSMAAIHQWRRL